MMRVILPVQLCALAKTGRQVDIQIEGSATIEAVLDALEARYPMLRGTLRDQVTKQRRPFVRFYASGEDLSLQPPDYPLPGEVVDGREPFRVVGSMAGG